MLRQDLRERLEVVPHRAPLGPFHERIRELAEHTAETGVGVDAPGEPRGAPTVLRLEPLGDREVQGSRDRPVRRAQWRVVLRVLGDPGEPAAEYLAHAAEARAETGALRALGGGLQD